MDKISIVVPVYNVAPYLDKCLQSIIEQTHSNLEIICVDDGSTDGSGEILDRYAEQDERFRVFHQENRGTGASRNLALSHATGTFIGFVDSDDWIEPNMFEELYLVMQNTQVDVATCGYYIDSDSGCVQATNRKVVLDNALPTGEFLPYIYERDTYKGVGGYLWTRLFRAEVVMGREGEGGVFFDETLIPGQDVYFIAQCCVRAKSMMYMSTPLYHYVQRESSVMHQPYKRLENMSSCKAYEMTIALFESNGVSGYVINLLKRFYVYHASLLLKMAYDINDTEKIRVLKGMIRKYLSVYVKTNLRHSKRIVEVLGLLLRGTEK